MAHAQSESRLRGAITAAASLLGVRIEIHDGVEWEVHDGAVRVGLRAVEPEQGRRSGRESASGRDSVYARSEEADALSDEIVARVLLLLWESVREARTAPLRRSRRLAIARMRPELEPVLAGIDRLLACAELLATFPQLRTPLLRAVLADLSGSTEVPSATRPAHLPRHLQWVAALLVAALDARAGERLAEKLAPEVREEFGRLAALGAGSGASVLRLALAPSPQYSPMQRFERAYGLLVPPYERLLAFDLAERGLGDGGGAVSGERNEQGSDDDAGFGAQSGGDGAQAGDAEQGGDAEHTVPDDETDAARAGDRPEKAEGADLFAAERAGFVRTVLATPLPANGSWVQQLELADAQTPGNDRRRDERTSRPSAAQGPAGGREKASATAYRDAVRRHAGSIEEMREVWRSVVTRRLGMRSTLTRTPQADGELLDTEALVRAVSEVHAGVELPAAFRARRRRARRTLREGSTDYVLLVDRSASMQGMPADAAAEAALIVLESLAAVQRDIAAEERAHGVDLELELRTALIVFDSEPLLVKPLSKALSDDVRRRMHAEIRTPRGSTDDAAALAAARRQLVPSAGAAGSIATDGIGAGVVSGIARRRIVIVVGDGGTNDAALADRELRLLRAAGAAVIGVGLGTDDLSLRYAPDGLRLDSPTELAAELRRIVESTIHPADE